MLHLWWGGGGEHAGGGKEGYIENYFPQQQLETVIRLG